MTYYNDRDLYVCEWLLRLEAAGEISPGTIDARPIEQLTALDVSGHTWAHFFAGIGGWDLALRWAGWPHDAEIWTGSPPCQPFSKLAQNKQELADERHLFPTWLRLVEECRPATLIGEQVADRAGRAWLASVFDSLEHLGYAVASADLGAACVGAPHIRQRLFWVAHAWGHGLEGKLPRRAAPAPAIRDRRDPWGGAAWMPCRDGATRPVGPGLLPVADGVPARMERVRAAGNAIVPILGAAFVRSAMEALRG